MRKYLWGIPVMMILGLFLFVALDSTYVNEIQYEDLPAQELQGGTNVESSIIGYVEVFVNGVLTSSGHNLQTNLGKDMVRDLIMGASVDANITTIGLCNSTASCPSPVVGDTAVTNEFVACGLTAKEGTTTIQPGIGNVTISATFISSTCAASLVGNVTYLRNSTGSLFAAAEITEFTLDPAQGDKVTINYTVTNT